MANGFIQVKNTGEFVATFDVYYTLDGKEISSNSGHFTTGVSKSILIPDGATKISLKIKEEYFIWSWSTVLTHTFDHPPNKCYEISGLPRDAHAKEVPCEH
jgi:hypothetical protein